MTEKSRKKQSYGGISSLFRAQFSQQLFSSQPSLLHPYTHLSSTALRFLSLILRDSATPGLLYLDAALVAGSDPSPSDMHRLTHAEGDAP